MHTDKYKFKPVANTLPNFMALLYRKHRIGAYGSRELCAYGKRVWLHVTMHSLRTRLAQKFGACM